MTGFFFFNDTATTEIYTLSLHDALPISPALMSAGVGQSGGAGSNGTMRMEMEWDVTNFAGSAATLQSATVLLHTNRDRKSTRLNSSHLVISYAVFCLEKK